jgi:hypothetical protein
MWYRKSSMEGDGDDSGEGVTSRRKTTRLFRRVFQGEVVGNRNQD